MPTGYTYKVSEQDVPFEEFVWSCAKAMGAFIHMRDDSSGSSVRLPEPPDNHYEEQLEKAQAKLVSLHGMDLEQVQRTLDLKWEDEIVSIKESIQKEKTILARYTSMLNKVKDWVPPTEQHVGLKDFMIEQLTSSIKFDTGSTYYQDRLAKQKPKAEEWLKTEIESTKDSIRYYAEQKRKQNERYEANVKWINELMEAVPLP